MNSTFVFNPRSKFLSAIGTLLAPPLPPIQKLRQYHSICSILFATFAATQGFV